MEPVSLFQPQHTTAYTFTAIAFAVAMLWESISPRRKLEGGLLWRWSNNFGLGALSWYVSAVVGTWFLLWLSQWAQLRQLSLLRGAELGTLSGFFILLASSQFISYWTHRMFHSVAWLWPIHAVHHSDIDVDVSTSYRHHPLEPLIVLPIFAPVIMLLGVPVEAIVVYRLFDIAATIFSHSNVRIPEVLDKVLRWVVLTPDYHRIHHCSEAQFTNSNYGSLVPWFDYVFGTARSRNYAEQETMQLGLEYLREDRDNRLDQQLIQPLKVPAVIGNTPTAGNSTS